MPDSSDHSRRARPAARPSRSQPGSGLSSSQLIALNASGEISRATICALAGLGSDWWNHAAPSQCESVAALGVKPGQLESARRALTAADEVAARERGLARKVGARIMTLGDENYPSMLKELALPPPVLYIRGSLPRRPCLAMVGAREATGYGRDVASGFAADLADRGLGIVSGFARGVDVAAHRAAARAAGGATVAALGCGIDIDYPRGRGALRDEISQNGALVSEFPCGTGPLPQSFPIRNRIIAALGLGTLVVEATAKSGSLITARLALELGRYVYAVPGRIFDHKARGPNTLIRDGAFLVQHPKDILITLPQAVLDQLPPPVDESESDGQDGDGAAQDPPSSLPATQRQVLAAFSSGERVATDVLALRTALELPALQAALLELELRGWVRRHPGPMYARSQIW